MIFAIACLCSAAAVSSYRSRRASSILWLAGSAALWCAVARHV